MIPNNDGTQIQNPEEGSQKPVEKAEQKIVESPEIPQGSANPQPAQPATNDDAAAQSIANNLQNLAPQTQPPANALAQNPSQQPAKTSSSTDPYIKAAENVIEKDKNDPYQEEVDHEDVQIQYLHDRFGKDIKKS